MNKILKLIRDCIPALMICLVFGVASADDPQHHWSRPLPKLYTATCSSDTTNATTYSHDITIPDLNDGQTVTLYALMLGEDGASAYDVQSVTFDGQGGTQAMDFNGAQLINAAAFYLADRTGAATVTVAPTYSEAVTSSVVCLFAVEHLDPYSSKGLVFSNTTGDNASALLSLAVPVVEPGFIIAVCGADAAGSDTTWTGVTEIEDTDAEIAYSNASLTVTPGTDQTDVTVTCDMTGTSSSAALALSIGNANAAPLVKYTATCSASDDNLTEYTFSGVTFTGLDDAVPVGIIVGILAEDGATVYGVNSVTVDAVSLTERSDGAGVTQANAAMYATTTPQTGADSVDIVVTFSEAVTGAAVCAWAFENAQVLNFETNDSQTSPSTFLVPSVMDGGYFVGVCVGGAATTFTWSAAVVGSLTEIEDAQTAEYTYTNAEGTTGSGGSRGGTTTVSTNTCTPATGGSSSATATVRK